LGAAAGQPDGNGKMNRKIVLAFAILLFVAAAIAFYKTVPFF
jgi:hypothetical protein